MIKLKDILGENTKAAQDRMTKYRRVNESTGDVEVELNGKQLQELDKIFDKFKSDLNQVVDVKIEEKELDYTKMTPAELEEVKGVLKVDGSIMNGIEELLELGGEAKTWYAEMNKTMLETFGDNEGTIFLVLLAIFSPRNPLSQNFKLAAQTFRGLKKDLESEQAKAKLEEMMEIEPTQLYKMMKAEDAYKDLATVRGMIKGNMGVNTYLPNILRFLKLLKANNYQITREIAVKEIARHIKPSGALEDTTVISAEKVFSFTLNLLDPNYSFEDLGWVPVTMDTWMASFFYPQLDKKQKSKLLAKTPNYVYMARLTQEWAGKYGMTPPEFQAAIWVGMIKKAKGENYDNTFLTAIDKNLKKLNIKIEEIKQTDNFFKRAIAIVGDKGIR
jgi:hypothetical protein